MYIPEKLSEEEEECDFESKSSIATQLEKKVDELAVQGSISSVEDFEERFAATTGKAAGEDDV